MKQLLSVVLVAGLASFAGACGGGSDSPTASSSIPTAAAVVSAPHGATIQGTIQGPLGSASAPGNVHAQGGAAGVKVSVVGTALSARSDDAGRFVIGEVPPGRVELRFEAPGVDARLEIEHVAEGEMLTIEVHVSGSQATLSNGDEQKNEGEPGDDGYGNGGSGNGGTETEHETEIEFSGAIASLSPLMVAGRIVAVDAATRILDHRNNPIAFSALHVGDRVEVEGTSRNDRSVLARKIKRED